jgi:nitrite reductase/ring-hydroxylating ferredoxin subunit
MHRLAALDDLDDLMPIDCTIGERQLTVVRVEEQVYAFAALCSHRDAPLADGAVTRKRTVLCPWHLGTFRLRDGSVVAGPPDSAITTYPVAVRDGVVYLMEDDDTTDTPEQSPDSTPGGSNAS